MLEYYHYVKENFSQATNIYQNSVIRLFLLEFQVWDSSKDLEHSTLITFWPRQLEESTFIFPV